MAHSNRWEKIRKEFYESSPNFTDDNHHDVEPYSMQKIADWWMWKIYQEHTAAKQENINKIVTYIKSRQDAGYEAQTIVEELSNSFTMENVL